MNFFEIEFIFLGIDKNIQQFMEYLSKRDKTVLFPDQYLMVGRTSLLLRGLGTLFSCRLETAREWRAFAEECLKNTPEDLIFQFQNSFFLKFFQEINKIFNIFSFCIFTLLITSIGI